MKFDYYWNDIPGTGLCRNNLIYTSLVSEDKKTFCQWFYNDGEYHKGKNEVVDPALMQEKWNREIKYITLVAEKFPEIVPEIQDIDHVNRKLYLKIDGVDFWQRSEYDVEKYDKVLPNWKEQKLNIIRKHKSLDLFKYSMHPSSYFIVDGQLKSFNYFFVYAKEEGPISLNAHKSHIYSDRQKLMQQYVESLGISWNDPEPLDVLQRLCFDSFRTNYPADFIDQAKEIYK